MFFSSEHVTPVHGCCLGTHGSPLQSGGRFLRLLANFSITFTVKKTKPIKLIHKYKYNILKGYIYNLNSSLESTKLAYLQVTIAKVVYTMLCI